MWSKNFRNQQIFVANLTDVNLKAPSFDFETLTTFIFEMLNSHVLNKLFLHLKLYIFEDI